VSKKGEPDGYNASPTNYPRTVPYIIITFTSIKPAQKNKIQYF